MATGDGRDSRACPWSCDQCECGLNHSARRGFDLSVDGISWREKHQCICSFPLLNSTRRVKTHGQLGAADAHKWECLCVCSRAKACNAIATSMQANLHVVLGKVGAAAVSGCSVPRRLSMTTGPGLELASPGNCKRAPARKTVSSTLRNRCAAAMHKSNVTLDDRHLSRQ
jgi:hypothetical protein